MSTPSDYQPTTPLSPQQAPVPPEAQSPQRNHAPAAQQNYAPAAQQNYAPAHQAVPAAGTTLGATNTFAFLAIIFAFLAPLAGIIFGHMGLNQIKRTGDAGRGIALTGLIISYAYFAFIILFVIFYATMIAMIVGSIGSYDSYSYSS